MNSYIDLIRSRRSIRKFTSEKVPQHIIEQLSECVLRSPSSMGINPWEFVFVDDKTLLNHLSACKEHGAEFLKNAPLAVVICADKRKNDVWIEDSSIAAFNLQLAAHSLGLGSCWIQVRKRKTLKHKSSESYIRKLIGASSDIFIQCIIALGFPNEKKKAVDTKHLKFCKIHMNTFFDYER